MERSEVILGSRDDPYYHLKDLYKKPIPENIVPFTNPEDQILLSRFNTASGLEWNYQLHGESELTSREMEVLQWELSPLSAKEIATKLGMNYSVVKNLASSLYAKLHVISRSTAVITAVKRGIVQSPYEDQPLDPTVFQTLTSVEIQDLEEIVSSVDEKGIIAYKQVTRAQDNHLTSIYKKFGGSNKVLSCLLFMEAQRQGLPMGQPPQEISAPPPSRRQVEVLQLVAEGFANKDIADGLGIDNNTVKNHLTGLYRKLGVRDRYEAVLKGIQMGIVQLNISSEQIANIQTLTPAEQNITSLLVEANITGDDTMLQEIDRHTLKNHLTSIYNKLGIRNKTYAIVLYFMAERDKYESS